MDQGHGTVLDRMAFSQMILTALAHDFVTPFRTATACCKQLEEHARSFSLFNASDIRQIEDTRAAISKQLFPKLLGLHDGAKRLQGRQPQETVAFLLDKVDDEINARIADLRALINLAGRKDPHSVLDDLLDHLETTTQKIQAMMDGIKATIGSEPTLEGTAHRVAIRPAVERVEEMLRPLTDRLEVRVYGNGQIEGHPWRIWSVFSNLIGNAIKYAHPGAGTTVEVRIGVPESMESISSNFREKIKRERVSDQHYYIFLREISRVSQWCEINVTDFGIGIPQKKQWGIFKLFKQLKNDASPSKVDMNQVHRNMIQAYANLESADPSSHMGIGMGLALAQYYIRSHGGELVVSSRAGGPTTFGMWLPLVGKSSIDPGELRPDVWWRG